MLHTLRATMLLVRSALLLLPLTFAMLTWWSAEKVRENRALRQGDLVALLSDGEMPALHPYLPQTEADHQLIDLVYAPLIKVGSNGRITPALASEWRWLKRVTVWFTKPGDALSAHARLMEAKASRWTEWKLDTVTVDGAAMRLTFFDPMFGAVREVLQAAQARLVPVFILRIEAKRRAHIVHDTMMKLPDVPDSIQRLWFDGDDAFEVAVAGVKPDFTRDLSKALTDAFPIEGSVTVRILAQQPTLEEPTIEFVLKDSTWHDGTIITAADLQATFDALRTSQLPIPARDDLRLVRAVEAMAPNRAHLVFWRHRGTTLCAWLGLPILPARWLREHPLTTSPSLFRDDPPPGSGPCIIEHRDHRSIVLSAAKDQPGSMRRLTLVSSFSGFPLQLGYSTNALDLFWPSAPEIPQTLRGETLSTRQAPARQAISLWFNTRREPLSDTRVRQALSLITNRATLATHLPHGEALPTASLFAPDLWLTENRAIPLPRPDEAEQLLADTGWMRGINGVIARPTGSLVLNLLVPANQPLLASVAAELRMQWLKFGVQLNVRSVHPADLRTLLHDRAFDLVLQSTSLAPSWDLLSQWHTDEPGNLTGYSDRQADLLLEALAHEFDPDEAAHRTRRVEQLILESHAVLPLVTLHPRTVMRTSLAGTTAPESPWTLRDLLSR